ncbi:hypothetical protein LSAT2_022997 [Lamellibrachia satsuma]|nr:hypothetical protein LSAT2_022997 [Lamellibrachia satsuma]
MFGRYDIVPMLFDSNLTLSQRYNRDTSAFQPQHRSALTTTPQRSNHNTAVFQLQHRNVITITPRGLITASQRSNYNTARSNHNPAAL